MSGEMISCRVAFRMAAAMLLGATTSVEAQFNCVTNGNVITLTRYGGLSAAVTIPDFVTSIGAGAFANNSSVNSVALTTNVTAIEAGAFEACVNLASVTLTTNVASIGPEAFANCINLTNFATGSSLTTIGMAAFADTRLSLLVIPGSVITIGQGAFLDCGDLTNITVSSENTNFSSLNGVLFDGNQTTLIEYPIGNSAGEYTIPDSATSIGEDAFFGSGKLSSVTIGSGILSIGSQAFAGCSNLKSVLIPSDVRSIASYAFQNCSGLTYVAIPNSVTNIGDGAYYACTSLTNVNIGSGVTSIGGSVFYGCMSLTEIIVDAKNANYCGLNGVLFNNSQTVLIQYPIGNPAESYSIPDNVTAIQPDSFEDCASLKNITIGSGVALVAEGAFFNCNGLTNVTLGVGVTSIGEAAFGYCASLTNIFIPGNVTDIQAEAFEYCTSLAGAFFSGNAPIAEITGGTTVFYADTAVAYYLSGTTNWGNFSTNSAIPAVLWNPVIQSTDGSLRVSNNHFGFNITGTTNIPIVVEVCTNLSSPNWTPLQAITLTNGLFYFTESLQTNGAGRYYRVSAP